MNVFVLPFDVTNDEKRQGQTDNGQNNNLHFSVGPYDILPRSRNTALYDMN